MLSVEFILEDPAMPRTVFWEQSLSVLEALPVTAPRRVFLPREDIAIETNWPRYANGASSYVRGNGHDLSERGTVKSYYERIVQWARKHPADTVLIVNMHPFLRISTMLRSVENIHVADGCLSELDRSVNARTISMPALPIQASERDYRLEGRRKYLASFQGVLSHPVRAALGHFHDAEKILIRIVDRARHSHLQLDATAGKSDGDYREIMEQSDFAFIPRGDALFSYRLLEAMSYGCIPIVLSDNWVLPLDRLIEWSTCALRPREDEIGACVSIVKNLSDTEVLARKQQVLEIYRRYFSSLERIFAEGVLVELQQLLGQA